MKKIIILVAIFVLVFFIVSKKEKIIPVTIYDENEKYEYLYIYTDNLTHEILLHKIKEIVRAHVWTPVNYRNLVWLLLIEK